MSIPSRKNFLPDDEEDDEDAFHSADEGEDEKEDDQPIGAVPEPAVVEAIEPPTQSAQQPMTTPTPVPELISNEPAQMKEEPLQETKQAVDDGWGLDDWDGDADENMEENGWNMDETMVTPSTEAPPQIRQEFTGIEDVHNEQEATTQKPTSLWGGWGQLLSLATDSINTLTNTVGEGFTSVLETVETTLGAPTPEELAKLSMQEREALKKKADEVKEPAPVGEKDDCDSASEEVSSEGGSDAGTARSDKEEQLSSGYQSSDGAGFSRDGAHDKRDGLSSLISGVSHLFENTSKTIVSGSLDVLETLGRKTFETVTVSEPSGGNQRRRLKIPIPSGNQRAEKTTLSQALRELKEKAEAEAKQKQQEQEARRYNYAALFEDAQGLVHLEALELLSTTCCQQTRSLMELLTPDQVEDMAASTESLKLLFDMADGKSMLDEEPVEQDLALLLKQNLKFTSYSPSRVLSSDDDARKWITRIIKEQDKGERIDANEIYEKCLGALATFTAASVEMYHKIGQLLLVPNSSIPAITAESVAARCLISITDTLANELFYLCSRYTAALNTASDDSEDPDAVSRMLTSVFYEAGNSVGYVQEALKLMLPVVQLANVREKLR